MKTSFNIYASHYLCVRVSSLHTKGNRMIYHHLQFLVRRSGGLHLAAIAPSAAENQVDERERK